MKLFILATTISLSIASTALACGGADLNDSEVASLNYVETVKNQLSAKFEQEIIIESIVRSGNDILNLDKQPVVSAMCNANYIHVYFTTKEQSELVCRIIFEISGSSDVSFNGLRKGVVCRQTKTSKDERVDIDVNNELL